MSLIGEFRPALMFVGKFLALYFAGNILYGIYVESHGRRPDDITRFVTDQTVTLLNVCGYNTRAEDDPSLPHVGIKNQQFIVLNVFEGCNGVNVIIVFVAFLVAFGGPVKKMILFIIGGCLLIHIFNLMRIALLFYLARHNSSHFYYYHKYFFTATLYLVVFVLWVIWVIRFNEKRNIKTAT
jgi:exosortase family protein XrtF